MTQLIISSSLSPDLKIRLNHLMAAVLEQREISYASSRHNFGALGGEGEFRGDLNLMGERERWRDEEEGRGAVIG